MGSGGRDGRLQRLRMQRTVQCNASWGPWDIFVGLRCMHVPQRPAKPSACDVCVQNDNGSSGLRCHLLAHLKARKQVPVSFQNMCRFGCTLRFRNVQDELGQKIRTRKEKTEKQQNEKKGRKCISFLRAGMPNLGQHIYFNLTNKKCATKNYTRSGGVQVGAKSGGWVQSPVGGSHPKCPPPPINAA